MKRFNIIFPFLLILLVTSCSSQNVRPDSGKAVETAYDFTLPDQYGNPATLSNIIKGGRGAVIAFYPKDDSKN
jgi:AhpC/TSA family.